MSKKITHTIKEYIDPEIKVGDIVRVTDGSTLSTKDTSKYTEDLYIVYDYPELTGSNLPIKELDAIVIETGVKDKVIVTSINFHVFIYKQDIVLQIGETEFRCASQLVTKRAK